MSKEVDVKSWLDHVYYEIGKQKTNFRLTSTKEVNGEVKFSKWHNYMEAQSSDFIYKADQREQLKNEIILDLDQGDYQKLIKKLEKDGLKFYAYSTEEDRAIIHITTKAPDNDKRGELEPEENDPIFKEIRNKCYIFALQNWQKIGENYNLFSEETILKKRDFNIWKLLLVLAKFIDQELYKEVESFANVL